MAGLDRTRRVPVVTQVAASIRSNIASGVYRPGEAIPSERDLCARFAASRTTIRAAVGRLVQEGLLQRHPGAGTFVVDPSSSAPRTGSASLAFVLIEITNPWFAELAEGVHHAACRLGYHLQLHLTNYDPADEVAFLNHLARERSVQGILIAPAPLRDRPAWLDAHAHLRAARIPFAFVSHVLREIDADSVVVDSRAGAYDAVAYLIGLGHRHIGYVAHRAPEGNPENSGRWQGYLEALADHALTPLAKPRGDDLRVSVEAGLRATSALLGQAPRPTAVFAFNDVTAVGAYQAARRAGLRVPDDLSIVGFDNTSLAAAWEVPLTSVDPSARRVGELAVHVLEDRIRHPDKIGQEKLMLRPNLVCRSSCAPPGQATSEPA